MLKMEYDYVLDRSARDLGPNIWVMSRSGTIQMTHEYFIIKFKRSYK